MFSFTLSQHNVFLSRRRTCICSEAEHGRLGVPRERESRIGTIENHSMAGKFLRLSPLSLFSFALVCSSRYREKYFVCQETQFILFQVRTSLPLIQDKEGILIGVPHAKLWKRDGVSCSVDFTPRTGILAYPGDAAKVMEDMMR